MEENFLLDLIPLFLFPYHDRIRELERRLNAIYIDPPPLVNGPILIFFLTLKNFLSRGRGNLFTSPFLSAFLLPRFE